MKKYPRESKERKGHYFFGDYNEIDIGISHARVKHIGPFDDVMHYHKEGKEYYITFEGKAEIEIEGQTHIMDKNTVILAEAFERHKITKVLEAPFDFIVITSAKEQGDKFIVEETSKSTAQASIINNF